MSDDQTEQLEEIGNHNCFTVKSFGFGGLGVWFTFVSYVIFVG